MLRKGKWLVAINSAQQSSGPAQGAARDEEPAHWHFSKRALGLFPNYA